MSIRFTCMACQTIMKIGERISETKKVRCTGCGVVIVLTPDDEAPDGMTTSIPQQSPKTKREAVQPISLWLMAGGAGVLILIVAFGLWWTFRGPSDRAAIEGEITLDDLPMDDGYIIFLPVDGSPSISPQAPIKGGRYSLRAWDGPALGKNRVRILGGETLRVAPKYNVESTLTVDIKLGEVNKPPPFKVRSR